MMVQKKEPGTLFSVPLTVDGKDIFLYGYILYYGEFVLSNIFKLIGENQTVPDQIEESDFLVRDLVHDHMVFIKTKRVPGHIPWILSKRKINEIKGPMDPLFIFGGHTSNPLIFDIQTEATKPASPEDVKKHQGAGMRTSSYYRLLLEAKILGRHVVFNKEKKKYEIQ